MILSPLTLILSLTLFATGTIAILITITFMRITRIARLESQMAQIVGVLNTSELTLHLQTIPISSVDIDAEVAALKANIINAAHKHHLTVNKDETQPESPFTTPENQERLIAIVEKQKQVAARVG